MKLILKATIKINKIFFNLQKKNLVFSRIKKNNKMKKIMKICHLAVSIIKFKIRIIKKLSIVNNKN